MRTITLCLTAPLLGLFLLCAPQAWAQTPPDSDGDGTSDSTDVDDDGDGLIEIRTLAELNNMRHDVAGSSYKSSTEATGDTRGCPQNGCHGYELMTDLDFSDPSATGYEESWDPEIQVPKGDGASAGWAPVGDRSGASLGGDHILAYPNAFSGTFDGNNHTISNLYVNLTSTANRMDIYAGLFGIADGTLKNLGLAGEHMSVSATSTHPVTDPTAGGLVGFAHGNATITDCHVAGAVSASSSSPASDSSPSAGGLVGGIFTRSGAITLTNCRTTASVTASSDASLSDANSSYPSYAGGLVGAMNVEAGTITLTNCRATANVTASSASYSGASAGGLVGSILVISGNTTIKNSYAIGNATADSTSSDDLAGSNAGGLVGWIFDISTISGNTTIKNSYAIGNATANNTSSDEFAGSNAGGLVGNAKNNDKIINCYATGNVTSTANDASIASAGGISAWGGTVTASYYSGAVKKGNSNNLTDAAQVEGKYKTETQLKALVAATSGGWSELNWDFGDNTKLPRLRSYKEDEDGNQVQGELLEFQESAPPAQPAYTLGSAMATNFTLTGTAIPIGSERRFFVHTSSLARLTLSNVVDASATYSGLTTFNLTGNGTVGASIKVGTEGRGRPLTANTKYFVRAYDYRSADADDL